MQRKTTVIIGVFILASIAFTYVNEAQAENKPAMQQSPKTLQPASRFECRGNEPFWKIKINGDAAEYSKFTGAPDMKKDALKGQLKSLDYLRPPLFVWRGRVQGTTGDVVVFIENRQCLDSMSDQEGQSNGLEARGAEAVDRHGGDRLGEPAQ